MEALGKQLQEIESHLNSITSTIFHRIEGIDKNLEKIEEKTEKIKETVETIERLCMQNRRRISVLEDTSNRTREAESVQQTNTKVFIVLVLTEMIINRLDFYFGLKLFRIKLKLESFV